MRRVPVFTSLHGYQQSWFRADVIAGITVWAVLVPESLAYASIAKVSPVVGLYAAPAALLFYAAFGSSRHLVTGASAATAALSAAAVGDLVVPGTEKFVAYTAALAITAGLLALAAGLLRLGFLAHFISQPVLKGFIIGLALTIMVGQLPKLFGVPDVRGDFFRKLWDFLGHLDDTSVVTLLVGAGSLALVLVLRRLAPSVPGSLIALFLAIAAVKIFDLSAHGVAIVGHIDSGLPAIRLPEGIGLRDYGQLVASSLGIMLVGIAEGLGAAKTYAARDHYEIDTNRELIGLGGASVGAGLCSGMVVNGSLSKTAVNGSAGARTQMSGLVVAVLIVLTLLFLTGFFQDLPEATLAALVIAALIDLVDVDALAKLYRVYGGSLGRIYGITSRADFIAAMAALVGVLVFGLLPGLFIGIVASAVLLLYNASRPHVAVLGVSRSTGTWVDLARHPDAEARPGLVVVRPEGELFYANSDSVRREILGLVDDSTRAVVLDLQAVPSIDVSAAEMLMSLRNDLTARRVKLRFARYLSQVRDVLDHSEAVDLVPDLFPTVNEAIASLDREADGGT